MSEKRMFSQRVIDSDAYLDLSHTAQVLYFHICMNADDDGLIDNVKKIMRFTGCKEADVQKLLTSGFLIALDGGIYAVTHWHIHNTIRADRKKNSNHFAALSCLKVDDSGCYVLSTDNHVTGNPQPNDNQMATNCQPNDGQLTGNPQPNDRIDKYSIDKSSIDKGSIGLGKDIGLDTPPLSPPPGEMKKMSAVTMIEDRNFPLELEAALKDWVKYKTERKESYKETGLRNLLSEIENKTASMPVDQMVYAIRHSMSSNWKGIAWETVTRNNAKKKNITDIDYFLSQAGGFS